MSKIYDDPISPNLKPLPMTPDDMEKFKASLEWFMWIYNRTWVDVDEKALNRVADVICAALGYSGYKKHEHQHIFDGDPENLQ